MTPARWTPGQVVRERQVTVDEVDLFLFSAACWLPHRIHFDRSYARSEGLADVAIHGPLQAAWLSQLAAEWTRENRGTLRRMMIRHVNSAYPGEPLRCLVSVDQVEPCDAGLSVSLVLRVEKADREVVTLGSAVAEIAV
jgi:hydroxyacyl-ACP dehydratase HTD2-like protein with hotdog domain